MIRIIEKLLSDGAKKSKLSIALNAVPIQNLIENECVICRKCNFKECLNSSNSEFICSHGLSSYSKTISEVKFTAYGYIGERSDLSKYNKKERQQLRGRNLLQHHFIAEMSTIDMFLNEIVLFQERKSSEILHCFHDASKWANSVAIAADKIINKSDGETFNTKFNNATIEIKNIYQSSKLLVDSISMVEVYLNPDSAKFGDRNRTNIYRLFDKVQAILFHTEGKRVNKRFRLSGSVYRDVYAYESFQVIPLSLLQNALKYSKSPEIEIYLEENHRGILVKVTSTGPVIEESELHKIFEKRYRGKYAKSMHYDGMGIGLFIAQEIAKAHDFEINVSSETNGSYVESVPLAVNCFSFTFPI